MLIMGLMEEVVEASSVCLILSNGRADSYRKRISNDDEFLKRKEVMRSTKIDVIDEWLHKPAKLWMSVE